jgi:hypothetical protein
MDAGSREEVATGVDSWLAGVLDAREPTTQNASV